MFLKKYFNNETLDHLSKLMENTKKSLIRLEN